MDDELLYTTIVFGTNNVSPCDSKVIKDEIKKEPLENLDLTTSANRSQHPANRTQLLPLIASVFLGLLSLLLLSAIIYLLLHSRGAQSEMVRRVEDLKRERDALNWTLNVITAMEVFQVKEYCPQKVCKPCQKGWVSFGSSCYLFSNEWKSWSESRDYCRQFQAQLVVIQTQEEQKFIANHTVTYNDNRGYWTGGKWQAGNRGTWDDGSEITTTYWVDRSPTRIGCINSLKRTDLLASWRLVSCFENHRFICESPVLMKAF
ncbi:unnamed protein product [Gadus morhua 'NCC']